MNVTQNIDLIEAKTRLTNAKAAQAEIKLKLMQGEFVPLKEVQKKQADEISRVRTKLLALPAKLARQMADTRMSASAVNELLTREINEALTELSTTE